jgi:uncharacterized protein (DUF1684 family)
MLKLSTAVAVIALVFQASTYQSEIESFREQRAANISAETGWAALTDLQWLDAPGQFTIGRAASNKIVLHAPSAPPQLGTVVVTPSTVTFRPAPGVDAGVKGQPIKETVLTPDAPADEAVKVNGLTLALIDREHRRALRVWDRQSPTRQSFRGLRWYPIAAKWRVDARYEPHQPAPVMRIQNIVGQIVGMTNPGAAVFTVDGKTYRLEALLESPADDELFFMFRDGTSGTATYGAGRYLYTPLPKNGRVVVDFNRAINPPCAFTKFATCPLPPPSNRLSLPITAGEMAHDE